MVLIGGKVSGAWRLRAACSERGDCPVRPLGSAAMGKQLRRPPRGSVGHRDGGGWWQGAAGAVDCSRGGGCCCASGTGDSGGAEGQRRCWPEPKPEPGSIAERCRRSSGPGGCGHRGAVVSGGSRAWIGGGRRGPLCRNNSRGGSVRGDLFARRGSGWHPWRRDIESAGDRGGYASYVRKLRRGRIRDHGCVPRRGIDGGRSSSRNRAGEAQRRRHDGRTPARRRPQRCSRPGFDARSGRELRHG